MFEHLETRAHCKLIIAYIAENRLMTTRLIQILKWNKINLKHVYLQNQIMKYIHEIQKTFECLPVLLSLN
jgi:hypothetical protein